MSKTVATIFYIELRRTTHTAQVMVVPPVAHPVRGTMLPGHILTRQVSVANPRRGWKTYATPMSDVAVRASVDEAVVDAARYVNNVAPYFSGFATGGWATYMTPLAVDASLDDIEEINTGDTPNALIRRIMRARAEAGYDEALYASE